MYEVSKLIHTHAPTAMKANAECVIGYELGPAALFVLDEARKIIPALLETAQLARTRPQMLAFNDELH